MRKSNPKPMSVFSGVRWSVVGQLGKRGISFGISVILARLLAPEDFGLLAMAVFVIGFLEVFYELGIGSAIIQKKELSSELLSSLYFMNIAFGLVLGGILWVSGSAFAWFYRDPRVAPIVGILGLTFVISSFGVVHEALLRRNMCFNRLVQIELFVVIIDGTVAVTLAFLGLKVWALVAAILISKIAFTLLLSLSSSWWPCWCFRWDEVRKVFRFSLNLTGFKILNYFARNSHNFIIGRFLGARPLGYYGLAHKFYMYPIGSISTILGRVLFPACARLQDDNAELRKKYLRTCGGIALIIFPMMIGLSVVARPFVIALFGAKWSPAIPLIMILAPIGMLQSVMTVVGHQIFLVKGRSDWLFWWGTVSNTIIIVSLLCGLPWGVIGVASAYAIVMLPLTYLGFSIPFRLIDLRFGALVATLRPYTSTSAVMAILVSGCRWFLEHLGFRPPSVLAVCVAIGVIVYTAIILYTRPLALADLMKLLPNGLSRFVNQLPQWQINLHAGEKGHNKMIRKRYLKKQMTKNTYRDLLEE